MKLLCNLKCINNLNYLHNCQYFQGGAGNSDEIPEEGENVDYFILEGNPGSSRDNDDEDDEESHADLEIDDSTSLHVRSATLKGRDQADKEIKDLASSETEGSGAKRNSEDLTFDPDTPPVKRSKKSSLSKWKFY